MQKYSCSVCWFSADKVFLLLLVVFSGQNGRAQADSLQRLKLLFAGDIMQHAPQIKAAEVVRNQEYDYVSCFKYVQPIIEQADLAIGNLEVTLPGKPPYTGYPNFRSPDDLAKGLKEAGFDVLVTSNNHSTDAGKQGVISTLRTVKQSGLWQTGTFENATERALFYPLLVYKNGFRLAFLNYTYGVNNRKTYPPTIVNKIDTALMKEDIARAHQLRPDAIIMFMHWGQEYRLKESKKQRQLADWMLAQGVDVVIGAHPHVVQPVRETTVEGQRRLVVYSMGNFISNQNKPYTDGGIMVEIELVKPLGAEKSRLTDWKYIPVWRWIQKQSDGSRNYFVLPHQEATGHYEELLNSTEQQSYKKFVRHLEQHLGNEKKTKGKGIFN